MVEEPEELLRSYLLAGDRRDDERLLELMAPDIVTHSPGDTTTTGRSDNIATWAAAHAGLANLTHEVRDVVCRADMAVARVRASGRHTGEFMGISPTGRDVTVDQALFVRIESGRIAEMWEVVDTGSGLRQLGVLGDQSLGPGLSTRDDR